MLRTAFYSLLKPATFVAITTVTAICFAQTPVVPTPANVMAPLGTPAAAADPAGTAFNAVREAIGRQDYNAARIALEQVRSNDPNNPGLAVYENIIERRQTQGQSIGTQSPLPTVRAGVTPEPRPAATPTPVPTPEIAPAPVATPAPSGIKGKVDDLLKKDMVKYGAIGAGALILLGLIYWFLKKRRSAAADEESPAITSGLGSYEDPFAPSTGLSTSPLSTDFNVSSYGDGEGEAPLFDGSAVGGAPLGGSAMGAGMAGFTMPSFGVDDEEETPAPKRPAPAPTPVEDEGPVNLYDDEPVVSPAAPLTSEPEQFSAPVEPASISSPSEPASFDALGINFGSGDTTPAPINHLLPDDQTTIIPPSAGGLSNTTPTSTPSISPGTVDLEDIFGSQPLPGSAVEEDVNSQTLPTFVSTPGVENPEEVADQPPAQNRRPAPEPASDTQSISFEELFGSPEASSVSTPAVAAPVEPEPAPADLPPARAMGDMSIEDALAATIGAMADEKPFDEQPTIMDTSAPDEPSTESLDERSERMFMEQMDKARNAFTEKNWRQAVHFLSIASALHPEHEEARQKLKEARAEKRKSEESV